jgi:hypothetical protein
MSTLTLDSRNQDVLLVQVTRLAYPTAPVEIRDQLAKDCFVRAVNDSKIQLSIFQREPKTIDDCVRFGLESLFLTQLFLLSLANFLQSFLMCPFMPQ